MVARHCIFMLLLMFLYFCVVHNIILLLCAVVIIHLLRYRSVCVKEHFSFALFII